MAFRRMEACRRDGRQRTMKVLEYKRDLSCIEARMLVRESASLAKVGEELATDNVLEQKIEVLGILEVAH